MTSAERELLLTVARILRARIKQAPQVDDDCDDFWALNEALRPFDPSAEHGGNFAALGAR